MEAFTNQRREKLCQVLQQMGVVFCLLWILKGVVCHEWSLFGVFNQRKIVLGDGGYRGTAYVMAHQLFKLYPLHTH